MITHRSRLWVIALSLLILTSYFPSDGGSAASAPAELFRKVPANSAVLVFINTADHKLCLRLTSGKGLSSVSPLRDSQASVELLKFAGSVWGSSGDGSNVRQFIIRGASADSNQGKAAQAEPPVFKLAGYPNSEWILTVAPVKRLDRSAIPSSTPPSVGTTPTPTPTPPPSGSDGGGFRLVLVSMVVNGGLCGRGRLSLDCDPMDDCTNYGNVELIPGLDLPSDWAANATVVLGARGDTIYTYCARL